MRDILCLCPFSPCLLLCNLCRYPYNMFLFCHNLFLYPYVEDTDTDTDTDHVMTRQIIL